MIVYILFFIVSLKSVFIVIVMVHSSLNAKFLLGIFSKNLEFINTTFEKVP